MRRLTVVFLAVCLLLSSVPFVFANAAVAEYDLDTAKKAYNFLSALGIMDGVDTNVDDFLVEYARRDYLVYWALRAIAVDDNVVPDYGYAVFNDVPVEEKTCNYVNFAYYLGIVSGKSPFIFAPEDPLTGNDALKIIVLTLGGDVLAEEMGGYPSGYWNAAVKLGLKTGGISAVDGLTNGDAAILLKNMLYATTAVNTGKNIVKDDQNVLEKYHQIKSTVGVIVAAGGMRLTPDDGLDTDKNSLIINGIKMISKDPTEEYFGMYGTVYYKEEDGDNIFVYADISDNKITVIQSEDIISTKNNSVTFNEKTVNFETTEKERTITFSGNADVVYNGRPCPTCTADMLDISDMSGEIILIGHHSSSTADVVIINAVSNYVVASVDAIYKTVYAKMPNVKLDFSGASEIEVYNAYGNEIDMKYIFAGDVLSVLRSADGESVKLITCSHRENRRVAEILEENKVVLDNKKICIIDRIAVTKAQNELLMGRLLDISYDYRGRICDFLYSQYEDDIRYVYMTKMGGKVDPNVCDVLIRVYTLLGVFETYRVAEKLHLDGDYVESRVFYNTFIKTDPTNGEKYVEPQMIKISVNKDGEVNYIDSEILGPNEGDESLHITHHASATYVRDIVSLEGLNVFDKGYFLSVPKPGDGLAPSTVVNIPEWEYYTNDRLGTLEDMGGTFEVIDPDPAGWASILVRRPKWYPLTGGITTEENDSSKHGQTAMFDKAIRTIDETGEQVIKVTYYTSAGKIVTKLLKDPDFIKKPVETANGTIYKDMERGDVFGYDERDGYLTWVGLRYNSRRTDNGKFLRLAESGQSGHGCGIAYGVTPKGVAMLCNVKEGTVPEFETPGVTVEEVFDTSKVFVRVSSNNFEKNQIVVIYDKGKDKITVGTIDDIVTYEDDNVCPSILVTNYSIAATSSAFVINNYK